MNITQEQAQKICAKLAEEFVNIDFLAKGNHNSNYTLETNKRKYVLRVQDNKQFDNLKKEYDLLERLGGKIGPKVFLFDDSLTILPTPYLIEEFLPGRNPQPSPSESEIIAKAKAISELHKIDTVVKVFSPRKAIQPFYANFQKYKGHVSTSTQRRLTDLFNKALKLCADYESEFKEAKHALLHKDLSPGNILIDGDKVRFIDWEFAEHNIIEWDLVYFLRSFEVKDEDAFLRAYGYSLSKKRLLLVSLLNTAADIGYSLWRMDTEEDPKISKRLEEDISLFQKIIGDLER